MRGSEEMMVAVCYRMQKARVGSCHREEWIRVSAVEIGSEKGTSGKMMSRKEGIGTPRRWRWEGANKMPKCGSSWIQQCGFSCIVQPKMWLAL